MRRTSSSLILMLTFLLLMLITGCDQQNPSPINPPLANQEKVTQEPISQQHNASYLTHKLTVYFATKDAAALVPEVASVQKSEYTAHKAMEVLLAGPVHSELVRVLPLKTKVRGIVIKNRIAYVDFNDKILKMSGSATETLAVASIVNTLTEFEEIEKVQILVEGKQVETLAGHLDVSQPLSRSEHIIRK